MLESSETYCTITSAEQRIRRSAVRESISPHVKSAVILNEGLRIELSGHKELRKIVEEFVVLERKCCGFLSFTISPPGEPLFVQIQGPPGASSLLEMFRKTLHIKEQ